MSRHPDPEMFDILQDAELMELADLLRSARQPEPPLDDAFRSSLRRQLMQKAWEMGEGRPSWWHRLTTPQGLAWSAAAVGVFLIGSVVVFTALQPKGGFEQVQVTSPIADANAVKLEQPILVAFSQPMDHASTEAAVQITPATSVSFQWHDNTLEVQPTGGNLAPNTQYQVTIGPGAMTSAGQQLAAPQQITFVTQPPQPSPTPSPSPTASPTPGSLLIGEHQLANLGGASTGAVQWSADSSTVYFVNAAGALESVPARGGDPRVLVPDGASSPALSPAGDRLAYIRGGKIQVLTLADGSIADASIGTPATIVGWAQDRLVWAASDGVYTQGGASGPAQLVPFPAGSATTVVSIAPDGSHAIVAHDMKLAVLDLATGQSSSFGPRAAQFQDWSPDGTAFIYSTPEATVVSDVQGQTLTSLHVGEATWSSQDGVLVGTDIELFLVHPDGFGPVKLANGTYHAPHWAPNGTTFVFFRGGSIWSATAPLPVHEPTADEQATSVVDSFMKARLANQPDQAMSWLDAAGKQAYASGAGLSLIIGGDSLRFSRYYILSGEVIQTNPDTARFVVRLVLSHNKIDKSELEETLTLVRDPATKTFLIDQAGAGARRDLGTGAQVVSVDVTTTMIKVSFDSDLVRDSVAGGVILLDAKGKQVDATTTYAKKVVTLSGLTLTPGGQYRLVVLSTVKDVGGHNVSSEYDLSLVGPVTANESGQSNSPPPPRPGPSPRPTPTPPAVPTA